MKTSRVSNYFTDLGWTFLMMVALCGVAAVALGALYVGGVR